MPPAARVGDLTGHPGVLNGPGVPTVLIAGRPAVRIGDLHVCALAPVPHPPTGIAQGQPRVLIGGSPAARVGDLTGCGAPILTGAPNVEIG